MRRGPQPQWGGRCRSLSFRVSDLTVGSQFRVETQLQPQRAVSGAVTSTLKDGQTGMG